MERLQALLGSLDSEAERAMQEARSRMETEVQTAVQGIIPPVAMNSFGTSLSLADPIIRAGEQILAHPVCGSEAAMEELTAFFGELGDAAAAVTEMTVQVGQAALLLEPAFAAPPIIAQQLASIAAKPMVPGSEAEARRLELEAAAGALAAALAKVAGKEGLKTVITGAEAGMKVAPFAAWCAGCATAVGVAVKGWIQTGAGATVTTSCPTTFAAFGGGCWAGLAIPQGLVEVVGSTLIGTPACGFVQAELPEIPETLLKVAKFAQASWDLMVALAETSDKVAATGQALVALHAAVGDESQAELDAIGAQLNAVGPAVQAAAAGLQPVVTGSVDLATRTLERAGDRISDLIECHNLVHAVGTQVSAEMLEVIVGELPLAHQSMVQGATGYVGVHGRLDAALAASSQSISQERASLEAATAALSARLWGPNPQDPVQVVAHVGAGLLNPTWLIGILNDILALELRRLQWASGAVTAGLGALTGLDAQAQAARTHFLDAQARSQAIIPILQGPPSPPLVTTVAMANPGFVQQPAVLTLTTLNVVPFQQVSVVPTRSAPDAAARPSAATPSRTVTEVAVPVRTPAAGRVDAGAVSLRRHVAEIAEVGYREVRPPRAPVSRGECLSCAREFELSGVRGALQRGGLEGAVTLLLVDDRGQTLVEMGRFASVAEIPDTGRVMPPAGGFSVSARGCGVGLEVRDGRGQVLERVSLCVVAR